MKQTPSAKDLIPLPGFFTFKVIIKGEGLEDNDLLSLAKSELERSLGAPELSMRPSRKGNYQAYTLKIYIEVYEEIEKLYSAFQNIPEVLMVL